MEGRKLIVPMQKQFQLCFSIYRLFFVRDIKSFEYVTKWFLRLHENIYTRRPITNLYHFTDNVMMDQFR